MNHNKGKSLVQKFRDYVVVDLETTGLDSHYDDIIELGAVRVVNGEVQESFQSLVRPSVPIDEFITDLTGITNEMLLSAPSIDEILPKYIEFLGTDIIIGHNINFDINFIYDNWMRISNREMSNDYVDTMRIARRVLPELQHHRLSDLSTYYHIDVDTAHRSLADCLTTNVVYQKLFIDAEAKAINLSIISTRKSLRASDIISTQAPDPDNSIYGKTIVFTGTLERMVRKDVMQLVVNIGGINGDNVTKKTNYLVLGNGDYSCILKDGKSNKHKKAEALIAEGADLQIVSEDVFFNIIGLEE